MENKIKYVCPSYKMGYLETQDIITKSGSFEKEDDEKNGIMSFIGKAEDIFGF